MMHLSGLRGRASLLLLLLAASLLSACVPGPKAPYPAAETAVATAAPGSITAHINGRSSFFMGIGSSN
jgi:hypothetical protein